MFDVLREISSIGIVPVVKLDRVEDAIPLGRALINGGLPCAEITFRTSAAEEAIKLMSREFPEMLIGAGTVLTTEQADRAMAAGAKFIVSPGLNPEVVKYCIANNYPVAPGVANPSDVETALSLGLDVVKFFPAENAGGVAMIKAMSAAYVGLKFMPTGGINAKNINDYLGFDKILACGGSWMVKDTFINAGEFDKIEQLTREAVHTMLGFELLHVGINCENDAHAQKMADIFMNMFGFAERRGPAGIFSAEQFEFMFTDPGTKGHIAIGTNSVDRAVRYLKARGVAFDEESAVYDNGKMKFIYLADEFAGFKIHLSAK